MTKYQKLWDDERSLRRRAERSLAKCQGERDGYLTFIRQTHQEQIYLEWLAKKMGLHDLVGDASAPPIPDPGQPPLR